MSFISTPTGAHQGSSSSAPVNVAYSSDDGEQHDPQQQQLRHSQQQQQQHHHHHNQHHEKQSPRPGLFVSAPADEESIRSMIQSKQKELQEMSEYQVQVLQAQAQDKDRALAASREKLDRLKADFTFNLGLIEERDGELAQFEGAVRDLQGLLHGKEVELSDAKVRLAEAAQQLDGERRRHAEREAHLLGRAKEARDEAEHLKWARDEAARLARADEEAARRDRERAAAERDELVERERGELVAVYDAKLRQWEDDARRRADELGLALKESESRCAELHRQKERQAKSAAEAERRLADAEEGRAEAEATHRQRCWELEEGARHEMERNPPARGWCLRAKRAIYEKL